MSTLHAPFVQPESEHGISLAFVAIAQVPASGESAGVGVSAGSIEAFGPPPPILYSPTIVPLRI